jgi:hypothetical protein
MKATKAKTETKNRPRTLEVKDLKAVVGGMAQPVQDWIEA